jgi:hypothetical protein
MAENSATMHDTARMDAGADAGMGAGTGASIIADVKANAEVSVSAGVSASAELKADTGSDAEVSAGRMAMLCYGCRVTKPRRDFRFKCMCVPLEGGPHHGVCKACTAAKCLASVVPEHHMLSMLHDLTPEYKAWYAAFSKLVPPEFFGARRDTSSAVPATIYTFERGPDGQVGRAFDEWFDAKYYPLAASGADVELRAMTAEESSAAANDNVMADPNWGNRRKYYVQISVPDCAHRMCTCCDDKGMLILDGPPGSTVSDKTTGAGATPHD